MKKREGREGGRKGREEVGKEEVETEMRRWAEKITSHFAAYYLSHVTP